MNKIYRVGTYYRLSDEDREKTSNYSESIKNQRNLLIDYINIHNNFILVDEYCDEDLSCEIDNYGGDLRQLLWDIEEENSQIYSETTVTLRFIGGEYYASDNEKSDEEILDEIVECGYEEVKALL